MAGHWQRTDLGDEAQPADVAGIAEKLVQVRRGLPRLPARCADEVHWRREGVAFGAVPAFPRRRARRLPSRPALAGHWRGGGAADAAPRAILAEVIEAPIATRRRPPKLPMRCADAAHWRRFGKQLADMPVLPLSAGREFDVNTKRIVEAILFAANKPMTIKEIQQVFPELEQPDTLDIQLAIDSISQDYLHRPIGLKLLASGYRFQIKDGMAHWVSRIFEEKPPRYSRAMLETIAIIAYRQPVTRGEIEDIRGVSVSSGIIHTLLEREWIRVLGHKEVPGRPALYGTTKQFLDYFNLSSLAELPALEDIANLDFSNEPGIGQEHCERPQTDKQTLANDAPPTPETGRINTEAENIVLH